MNHRDVSKRVWHPTLKAAGLPRRRPYTTRHTTASLWLTENESPLWVANQMGHSNVGTVFKRYARFVPNATQQVDGAKFNKKINEWIAARNLSKDSIDSEMASQSQNSPASKPIEQTRRKGDKPKKIRKDLGQLSLFGGDTGTAVSETDPDCPD